MDKLKDIKTILDIEDYSFYIFLFFIILALIILFIILRFLVNLFRNRKHSYEFNLNNPKQTAYLLISLIRDKENSQEYIDKLHELYTYKKDVPEFDARLLEEIVNKFKIKVKNVSY